MSDDQTQGKSIEERIENTTKPQAETPAVEEEQHQEPTPSSDKETPQSEVVESDEDKSMSEALENSKNPERTREYIDSLKSKLKEKDELLKSQNRPDVDKSVMESVYPVFSESEPNTPVPNAENYQNLDQTQVNSIVSQFIDQAGNVDIQGLDRALIQANKDAQSAKQETVKLKSRIEKFEQRQQETVAYKDFPNLNPKSKDFNQQFYNEVRKQLVQNMWDGKERSGDPNYLHEVAAEVKSKIPAPVDVDQIKKEAVEEYTKRQSSRNQGPIENGSGEDRTTGEEVDNLRQLSRRGGEQGEAAISKRLKALGI